MAALLLCISILLSAGRNLLSKWISDIQFGTRAFFKCQGILFLCGGVALLIFGNVVWEMPSLAILGYAAIYALFLIVAQWCYTVALFRGNTATCSTVYSLGFILPTLSGALIWDELFSVIDAAGVVCAALAVIVSGWRKPSDKNRVKTSYIIPLIIAMIASGGLGIVQKLQQSSPYADQKTVFFDYRVLACRGHFLSDFHLRDASARLSLASEKACGGFCNRCVFWLL